MACAAFPSNLVAVAASITTFNPLVSLLFMNDSYQLHLNCDSYQIHFFFFFRTNELPLLEILIKFFH